MPCIICAISVHALFKTKQEFPNVFNYCFNINMLTELKMDFIVLLFENNHHKEFNRVRFMFPFLFMVWNYTVSFALSTNGVANAAALFTYEASFLTHSLYSLVIRTLSNRGGSVPNHVFTHNKLASWNQMSKVLTASTALIIPGFHLPVQKKSATSAPHFSPWQLKNGLQEIKATSVFTLVMALYLFIFSTCYFR